MKVTILGTAHPFRGGLAAFNERMALELVNQGNEVTIETFTTQYPSFLFPGKSQYSDQPNPKKLKINRSFSSVNPFSWIRLGRRLKKEKPDVIIVKFWLPFMGPCFGSILRIAKKNRHTKVICVVDNMIPHEKRVGDKPFTKYFVKPVDGFVAMSQSVLEDVAKFTPTENKILSPHPIYDNFGTAISREEALKKLNLSADYRYLLFFGIIRKYKGLDLLLEAFSDDFFEENKIKLIVAGEHYDDKEMYDAIIEKNQLEKNIIRVAEFIPDDKVKLYFCAADLVVQPYKNATQSGITQIAYHFEKPMVVTDVGGLAELCPNEKVGYVVEPQKTAINLAIKRFFNEADKNEMLRHIQAEKKKLGWDFLINSIFSLLTNKK